MADLTAAHTCAAISPATPQANEALRRARAADANCPACRGAGGRTEDTSRDGITRKNWIRCGRCRGAGVLR